VKAFVIMSLTCAVSLVSVAASPLAIWGQDLSRGRWIDLTHPFDRDAVYWPTAEEFRHETVFAGDTDKGYYYSAYNFSAAEHGGTHIDAPIHFAEGHKTVDQLPVDQVIGHAAVIDVSTQSHADRDYQVSVADFEAWEAEHGRLPTGCVVLLNTGSSPWWPDKKKYMGTESRGEEAVGELHFPGLDPAAARWLVANREIKAIGLDTPSIDFGQSTLFESHRILFAEDIPALENVANLDQLPATGAFLVALPMKIAGGSGGPTRIAAFVPD
jgi:kynurenine formamidase